MFHGQFIAHMRNSKAIRGNSQNFRSFDGSVVQASKKGPPNRDTIL
tara:strand:- start:10961 stop:11098 length:138 start_codon:yes stop_codon:yes gene_type:complete